MLRHAEENDKRWGKGEMVCQGKHLSGAISMKAVRLETLEEKAGQRGVRMGQICDFDPNAEASLNVKYKRAPKYATTPPDRGLPGAQ